MYPGWLTIRLRQELQSSFAYLERAGRGHVFFFHGVAKCKNQISVAGLSFVACVDQTKATVHSRKVTAGYPKNNGPWKR